MIRAEIEMSVRCEQCSKKLKKGFWSLSRDLPGINDHHEGYDFCSIECVEDWIKFLNSINRNGDKE